MGTMISTHFGITYPATFPIGREARQKLARTFLFKPIISVEQIKYVLESPSLWADAGLLSEVYFISTPGSIRSQENYEKQFITSLVETVYHSSGTLHIKEDDYNAKFLERFKEWIIAFSFPRLHELDIIADVTYIKPDLIMDQIYSTFPMPQMPDSRIPDFISMYYTRLSQAKIDELLELYLSKHDLNQSVTNSTKSGNK